MTAVGARRAATRLWYSSGFRTVAIESKPQPSTGTCKMDPSPAAAEFEVRIDPARQVAAMIRALESPDDKRRESAVAGLVRQPDLALPALAKAREKASEKLRWWIDATLQRINQNSPAKL